MSHDPLCGLAAPCDDEVPEHGYCSMQHGMFCIHCHQWCICERLAQARADERDRAILQVEDLIRQEKGVSLTSSSDFAYVGALRDVRATLRGVRGES